MSPDTSIYSSSPKTDQSNIGEDGNADGTLSAGVATGIAIGTSATTALICALLWWVASRRRNLRRARAETNFAMVPGSKQSRNENDRITSSSTDGQTHQHPHDGSTASSADDRSKALREQARGSSINATPIQADVKSAARNSNTNMPAGKSHRHPRSPGKATPNLQAISEASEPSMRTMPPASSISLPDDITPCPESRPPEMAERSQIYTPSLYKAAPPDSIAPARLAAPPNLTTDYSAVSLAAFDEFAPWINSSDIVFSSEETA